MKTFTSLLLFHVTLLMVGKSANHMASFQSCGFSGDYSRHMVITNTTIIIEYMRKTYTERDYLKHIVMKKHKIEISKPLEARPQYTEYRLCRNSEQRLYNIRFTQEITSYFEFIY